MSITIASPGKFQTAYHLARYLDTRGELDRLITPIPYRRAAVFGVAHERTVCLGPFAYWLFGFQRYGPIGVQSHNQLMYSVSLGKTAARLMGEPSLFNGWCTTALEGIRRARQLGIPSVLQSGSTHIVWQTETLRAEFRRWGYSGPLTHPRLVARGVREIEEADCIIVPSRLAFKSFTAHGVPESKLVVVHWTVRPLVRGPIERQSGTPRILFVGTCSVRKGIPYLLRAFQQLETKSTLHLVGPIDVRLLRLLGGLPAGVEAIGPKRGADLAAEYRAADVFVLPSVEEGSAFVVSEAMAAGLPVVVSDQVGADHVEHGVNGYVVPARDVRSLAQHLDRLLADRERRHTMGAAAVDAIRPRTWKVYGREVYDRALRPLMS